MGTIDYSYTPYQPYLAYVFGSMFPPKLLRPSKGPHVYGDAVGAQPFLAQTGGRYTTGKRLFMVDSCIYSWQYWKIYNYNYN